MNKAPKSSQDKLGQILSQWRNTVVVRQLSPPFLDIACGDNRLVQLVEGGFGVDIVNYGQADLITQNFVQLPFQAGVFRTITIVASMNYFDDPAAVMKECNRVLAEDGKLIITMLNPIIGKLWHFFRESWAKYPGFSQSRLIAMAHSANLRIAQQKRFMFGLNNLYILEHG